MSDRKHIEYCIKLGNTNVSFDKNVSNNYIDTNRKTENNNWQHNDNQMEFSNEIRNQNMRSNSFENDFKNKLKAWN